MSLLLDFNSIKISFFQLAVRAQDRGTPPLSSQTEVTVNLVRNKFPPEFFPQTYTRDIDFTTSVGSNVASVSARDDDTNVRNIKIFSNHIRPFFRE